MLPHSVVMYAWHENVQYARKTKFDFYLLYYSTLYIMFYNIIEYYLQQHHCPASLSHQPSAGPSMVLYIPTKHHTINTSTTTTRVCVHHSLNMIRSLECTGSTLRSWLINNGLVTIICTARLTRGLSVARPQCVSGQQTDAAVAEQMRTESVMPSGTSCDVYSSRI